MGDVSANGNPSATLSPGRLGARVSGAYGTATLSWRHANPLADANFQLTEAGEIRIFEDGTSVELG